jgi:hypothetical protein
MKEIISQTATSEAEKVLERQDHLIALLRSPFGISGDVEVTLRQEVAFNKKVTCKVCITTTDDKGIETTVCVPIPCPKDGIKTPSDKTLDV